MVGVHRDERVMAAELGERRPNGLGEIAVVVTLDQVGDDLGVGLGAEGVALGLKLAAKLGVVLDDPVEDDVDLVVAVAVGMGVLLGHAAVCGPAGMGHTDRRRRRRHRHPAVAVVALDRGAQVREIADRTDAVDVPVRKGRDPGRVIAAVLELLQARRSGDRGRGARLHIRRFRT